MQFANVSGFLLIRLRLLLPPRSVHSNSVLSVLEQFRLLFVLRVQYFTVGRCFYTTIEYVLVATPTQIPALVSRAVHRLDIFIFTGDT